MEYIVSRDNYNEFSHYYNLCMKGRSLCIKIFSYMLDYNILTMTALFSFECVVWATSIFWRRYQGVCNDPLVHFSVYAFLFIV